MKALCESCIKRKTLYCPNCNECYSIENKPQWLGNYQALQEIERLNNIINELEKCITSHYIYGHNVVNGILDDILNKLQELRGK